MFNNDKNDSATTDSYNAGADVAGKLIETLLTLFTGDKEGLHFASLGAMLQMLNMQIRLITFDTRDGEEEEAFNELKKLFNLAAGDSFSRALSSKEATLAKGKDGEETYDKTA